MSTSGHVQYIRGYHYECGGYHVYIRGCSVHRRNTMSTSVGGGGEDHQKDITMHVGEQLDKSFQFLLKNPMYS